MANIMENDKDLSMSTSTQSFSDVLGGISSFIMNYFEMKFPKGMFKERQISNAVNANKLSKGILHVQKLPFLGMEFEYTGEETSMGTLPYGYSAMYHVNKLDRKRNYHCIFEDQENSIRIFAIPNRVRIKYNFILKYQTPIAAINAMEYIRNNFEREGINYINGIRLPSSLPKYFIDRIANFLEIDMNNPSDRDSIRNYFLDNSLNSIFEVKNLSTGNNTFMYEYNSNIMLQYSDEPTTDSNINNLSVSDATVNFGFYVETWVPSSFLLEMKDDDLERNAPQDDDKFKFDIIVKSDIIPRSLDNGMKLSSINRFVTDLNVTEDTLYFKDIIPVSMVNVIDYIKSVKGNILKVIEIKVYENNIILPDNKYKVDYDNFEIKTFNPDVNKSYTMAIYSDIKLINILATYIRDKRFNAIKKLDIF